MPQRLKTVKIIETRELPMVPLRDVVAYPGMMLPFDVGREASLKAVEICQRNDKELFAITQKDLECEFPDIDDLYKNGVILDIKQIFSTPDGVKRVLGFGISRARLISMTEKNGMYIATVGVLQDPDEDIDNDSPDTELIALSRCTKEFFTRLADLRGSYPPELYEAVNSCDDIKLLPYLISSDMLQKCADRQQILDTVRLKDRYMVLLEGMQKEIEIQTIEKHIQDLTRASIDKGQKQYFLREQLQIIRKELGDEDENPVDKLRAKLKASNVSDEVRELAERELNHMEHMAPGSPEISVSRSYVEFILELPWGKPSAKPFKLEKARRILEADHYGLEKVKERVLESLAMRAINPSGKAPILCLVGAPGVGKTSIARSVARALDRKFVRMSLGGIHDEAEIRGHRRTYIGAMPGRILSLVRQSKVTDPVFLLDEIDKLTSDMRGDPASALLEALDPEQNSTFADHYLDAGYDLSNVFFMTTANTLDTIPAPLLDRMEVIEVSSYTLEEKIQISKRHLWPKQLKEHALTGKDVRISEKEIRFIIEGYTAEAGVRTLEKMLKTLLRKIAVERMDIPEADRTCVKLNETMIRKYLGVDHYTENLTASKEPEVGMVNGLAWTSIGGKTLQVEAAMMPGSGHVELTGQLGDVFKESARTAFSYIRANTSKYAISDDFHTHSDLHVHVPEGAVPKDGPSAGIALTCAMLSAITGRPARQDVAMTGEITLRGRVLPIGGVKEKLLAANRMGIKTVILPAENEKDLADIPAEIRKKLDVHTVSRIDQAVNIVLGGSST